MSLKQIIRRAKIGYNPCVYNEFTIPGEPLIYSLKTPVGKRHRPLNYFRNKQWFSILKCFFRSQRNTKTPVVIMLRFYVSPLSTADVSDKLLKAEKTPAVYSYEVIDYTLSFLEMLHKVLFNSYKQVVKLDIEKFYSKNPRTVFKFLKYDEYVSLQDNNPHHPARQGICQTWEKRNVQSVCARYVPAQGVCPPELSDYEDPKGAVISDCPLCLSSTAYIFQAEETSTKSDTPHEAT